MIALLAATPEEARPLLAALRARRVAEAPFATYRFDATRLRPGGLVVVSGMGPQAAAAAAEYAIRDCGATRIVNFGVCGTLDAARVPVGAVRVVRRVLDGGASDVEPGIEPEPGPLSHRLSARLASVPEPVFGGPRRDGLARRADLVDMEGFAVARSAAALGARCMLVKGVTDSAGQGDRDTLRQNLAAVSGRVAEIVTAGLPDLAPLPPGLVLRLLRLVKVEHSVFSLPLLFAGAWLGAGRRLPPARVLALIVVAGVAARALGMAANRIFDRDLDALNRRTAGRELAAGTMTPRAAYGLAAVALLLYAAACAALGPPCLQLAPIPALFLIGYSILKRFTALCHFGIGACMALAPAGACVAVSGSMRLPAEVALLAAFAFFWISGFDVIYALQDLAADRRTGVRSLPARLGARPALWAAAAVHAGAAAALIGLWHVLGRAAAAGILAAIAIAALAAAYLPFIPLPARFFPISAVAGVAGALVPFAGGRP
jgi:4-hydroxybenzoate polyprenyltransferase